MKNLLSIFIFFSFMSVANADQFIANKADIKALLLDFKSNWLSLSDEELCYVYDKYGNFDKNQIDPVVDTSVTHILTINSNTLIERRNYLTSQKVIESTDPIEFERLASDLENDIQNHNSMEPEIRKYIEPEIKNTLTELLNEKSVTPEKCRNNAKKAEDEIIISLKEQCLIMGFSENTDGIGNCILRLMELENNNQTVTVTNTTSNSSQEIVDIEKQKLQAQREALKLQQDQLKAEQERVAQERRKAIQKAANKSIQQGQCLMNGGSTWDCM